MANEYQTNDGEESESLRKLFIGGLNRETTDEGLRQFYEQWGPCTDVIVMKEPQMQRSRGFGFVTFKKSSDLDTAMANRPHVIDNKTVDPKRAVPREEGNKGDQAISSKRLYLSGITANHSQEQITEYFTQFGSVEKVDIVLDKETGRPRGFAFVTFDDYDPVDKSIIKKYHEIGGSRCEAKKALSKEEQLKAQQNRDRLDRSGRSRGTGRDGGPGRGGYMGGGGGGGYGGQAAYGGFGGYAQGYGAYAGYGQQGWDQGAAAAAWNQQAGAATAQGAWGQGWGTQAAAAYPQQNTYNAPKY